MNQTALGKNQSPGESLRHASTQWEAKPKIIDEIQVPLRSWNSSQENQLMEATMEEMSNLEIDGTILMQSPKNAEMS